MKKLLLIGLLIVSLFVVSCSPKSDKIEISKYEQIYEDVETYLTFEHKGDRIISQEIKIFVKYGDFLYKNKEEAKAFYKNNDIDFNSVDGVEHSVEYQDKGVLRTTKLYYDKLDVKAFEKVSGAKLGNIKKASMKFEGKLLLKKDFKRVE